LQRSVALALARMHLRWMDNGPEYAARLLASALAEADEAEPEWTALARTLWAAALVGSGQQEQALQVATETFQDPEQRTPENALALAEALRFPSGPGGGQGPDVRQGAARLIVTVAELLGPVAFDPSKDEPGAVVPAAAASARWIDPEWQAHPEWQATWAHAVGIAWDLLGNRARALDAIRRQVALVPDNGDALETLATMLAATGETESRRQALSTWHQVERRSRAAGSRWWRAREARLELLRQLGEKAQASKLEQMTRVLYGRSNERR
jgi:tetratricopeptide (TPR) repeat protein